MAYTHMVITSDKVTHFIGSYIACKEWQVAHKMEAISVVVLF